MITINNQDAIENLQQKGFFSDKTAAGFYEWYDWSAEKGLERLVFRVSRTPKYLQGHLERIYYCFQAHLDEQLFGALIDLLLTLKNEGKALGKRMIAGSKSRLTDDQFRALNNYIDNRGAESRLMLLNRYSVFAKGLESSSTMVQLTEDSGGKDYDPLALARDYLEYSQLDNAINVLEQAILAQPERLDLHHELLSLYRSTRNKSGFNRIYDELSRRKINLPPEWGQLNDFLKTMNNE
jgi:hypothetical protein